MPNDCAETCRAARGYCRLQQFSLRDLAFEEIDPSRALPVLTLLHYLRSARPGSRYFALVDPVHRLPGKSLQRVPLWNGSALEVRSLRNLLFRQNASGRSRAYIQSIVRHPMRFHPCCQEFERYLRRNMPSADLLVTAVDPNLGFTGSSYRAANWQQWMTIKARPYLYDNGRYVTPRQLRERFGTSSLIELQAKYPGRFQQSRVRLLDSMIYCCSVNGETEVVACSG